MAAHKRSNDKLAGVPFGVSPETKDTLNVEYSNLLIFVSLITAILFICCSCVYLFHDTLFRNHILLSLSFCFVEMCLEKNRVTNSVRTTTIGSELLWVNSKIFWYLLHLFPYKLGSFKTVPLRIDLCNCFGVLLIGDSVWLIHSHFIFNLKVLQPARHAAIKRETHGQLWFPLGNDAMLCIMPQSRVEGELSHLQSNTCTILVFFSFWSNCRDFSHSREPNLSYEEVSTSV